MIAVQPRFAVAVAAAIVVMASPRVSSAAIQLPATKAELPALGREHRTAWDLDKAFEQQANGGSSPFCGFTFTSTDDKEAGPGTGQ